jgi:hypothetical protein
MRTNHFMRWLIVSALVVFGTLAVAGVASAAIRSLKSGGSVVVTALPTATGSATWSPYNEFRPETEQSSGPLSQGNGGNHGLPTLPTPDPNAVAGPNATLQRSWQGLNHYDQRTANGGNQYSLEPPDQGLCVGNGYVLESVNTILAVYNTLGTKLTGTVDLNTFFGLPAQLDRTTIPPTPGDFLSDPKCYFDTDTNRWFLSVLQEDPAPSVRAHTLLAVSQTSNPTGAWFRYSLDVTDDGLNGTPSHPGCPCFGDQPLIGADKYGFHFTTNEFGAGFNGAQIYATSKTLLESGSPGPVVQFEGPIPLAEGIAYSVQPATSPSPADYETDNRGTEYYLSSLEFGSNAGLDNRIATWAMTNTRSLNNASPNVQLQSDIVRSESYGVDSLNKFAARQKHGPHPFGEWGANHFYGGPLDQPIELLNANDDRMNQVVYAGNNLYSGVNTALLPHGDSTTRVGIAWFQVQPKINGNGSLKGTMNDQGYVAVLGNYVIFPSVGVSPGGRKVVIGLTLSGPDYYPSAVYSIIRGGDSKAVRIAGAGVGPDDGFTGYLPFADDRIARWGDYSAAVGVDGTIWAANEYIAQRCTVAEYMADQTCGGTRTALANWSTRISAITP